MIQEFTEHATQLDKESLQKLSELSYPHIISIFLPTEEAGKETRQNAIRFKNRLSEAEQQLEAQGMEAAEIKRFLKPALRRLDDHVFWQHQARGLAFFISPEEHYEFRLPLAFQETTVVAPHVHLKPLMPLLQNKGSYYLLAVSQNKVRVFHGSREGISEVQIDAMPTSLAEALRFDVRQMFVSARDVSAGQAGSEAAFYGQGAGKDTHKENILQFFHKLNDGLMSILSNEDAPLIFAGVDYLFPIFKQANHYSNLLDESIEGNPDDLSAEELYEKAWPLIAKTHQQELEQAKQSYQERAHTEQASSKLEEIIIAAHDGRIERLFVTLNKKRWGTYDSQARVVQFSDETHAKAEDLLNKAALWTLNNSGQVYALEPEDMPDTQDIAAVYRY